MPSTDTLSVKSAGKTTSRLLKITPATTTLLTVLSFQYHVSSTLSSASNISLTFDNSKDQNGS